MRGSGSGRARAPARRRQCEAVEVARIQYRTGLTDFLAWGWHGYWKNPGDSGIETQIAWQLPAGRDRRPIQYPVPDRLIIAGLMNYVYEGDYAQLIDVKVPAGVAPGTKLPLRAPRRLSRLHRRDLRARNGECRRRAGGRRGPARGPTARCSTASARRCRSRSEARRGSSWRRQPLPAGRPVPAGLELREPYFFPLTDGALAYAAAQTLSRAGDTLIVETDAPAGRQPRAVEGVLKLGEGNGLSLKAVPGRSGRRNALAGGRAGRRPAPRRAGACWARCSAGCCSTSCPASSRSSA
jgi:hypothetical protein